MKEKNPPTHLPAVPAKFLRILKPLEVSLLYVLLEKLKYHSNGASPFTAYTFPSMEQIGKLTGRSRRSLCRALKGLKDLHLIEVRQYHARGKEVWGRNNYRIGGALLEAWGYGKRDPKLTRKGRPRRGG